MRPGYHPTPKPIPPYTRFFEHEYAGRYFLSAPETIGPWLVTTTYAGPCTKLPNVVRLGCTNGIAGGDEGTKGHP